MKKRNQGFTLIEIMVVMVIVATLVGATLLSFPPVGDKLLKEEADRFTALISLAQDEAILQSNTMALEVTENGYAFYHNVANKWESYSEKPLTSRQFTDQIKTNILIDGLSVNLKERDKNTPQIAILSSGEMTPFVLTLQFSNKSLITLTVNASGEVEKTFAQKE